MSKTSSDQIMASEMENVVDWPRFVHLNKTIRKKGPHTCAYAGCWTKNVLPLSGYCVDHYYTSQVGKYLDEYRRVVEELSGLDIDRQFEHLHEIVVDLTMKSSQWRLDALLLAVRWDVPADDLDALENMIDGSPEMSSWYKVRHLTKAGVAG